MKKLSIAAIGLALLSLTLTVSPRLARAATCAIPYTFTNGTAANATQVNADFAALTTCLAAVVTGVTAGSSGNIVVAGSATAPTVDTISHPTFSGPLSGAVLLPTADLAGGFATYLTGGAPTSLLGNDLTAGIGDAGLVNAYLTGGFSFYNWNGTTFAKVAGISSTGQLVGASNAATTLAHIPPVYTQTGADGGAGMHIVTGSNPGVGAGSSLVVNLTNAAVFSSTSSYVVVATVGGTGGAPAVPVTQNSATQFTLYNNNGVTVPINWVAIGD